MFSFGERNSSLDALLNRPKRSNWHHFSHQPAIFLARILYTWRHAIPAQNIEKPVSVVCISDTHNSQPRLPSGDILVHAGDLTQSGSLTEIQSALTWVSSQPHKVKVVVAGNHDLLLDDSNYDYTKLKHCSHRDLLDWGDIIYLENAETVVTCSNGRRLKIYGSPLSARHGNWAFQYPRNKDVWTDRLPVDIDILITHGPPKGHLDLLTLGCPYLLSEIWRVRPRVHIFGHVHEGAGTEWLLFDTVQKAYEQTVIAGGGFWNLIRTVQEFILSKYRPNIESTCLLVNPSMVGGLRDNERRHPVKIIV